MRVGEGLGAGGEESREGEGDFWWTSFLRKFNSDVIPLWDGEVLRCKLRYSLLSILYSPGGIKSWIIDKQLAKTLSSAN